MSSQTFWIWLADGPNWRPFEEFAALDDAMEKARELATDSRVAIDTNHKWLFFPEDDPAFAGKSTSR